MSEKIKNTVYSLQKDTLEKLKNIYSAGNTGKKGIEDLLDKEGMLLANLGLEMPMKAEPAIKKSLEDEGAARPNRVWLNISSNLGSPEFKFMNRNDVIALEKDFEARSRSFDPYEAKFEGDRSHLQGLDWIPPTVVVLCVIGALAVIVIPGSNKKFVVPLLCIGASVAVICHKPIKRFLQGLLSDSKPGPRYIQKPAENSPKLDYSILTKQMYSTNEKAIIGWYDQLKKLSLDAFDKAEKK